MDTEFLTIEKLNTMTDEELIHQSRIGDSTAIDILMERYRNFVRIRSRTYFLIGADKEDLIQEGMIGLYKAIMDYNPNANSAFKSFAELCITRQIITAVKKATRQKHTPLNSYISLNTPIFENDDERILIEAFAHRKMLSPEEIILDRERYKSIGDKLPKILSNFERKVLNKYLEGKRYTEIAEEFGKSDKSIDNALQRIKKKIEKYIINDEDI